MVERRDIEPFNPILAAAKADVTAYLEELRNRHGSPDRWAAYAIAEYSSGERTVALFKPKSVEVSELAVFASGEPQEFASGDGLVAVLVRHPSSSLDVHFDGEVVSLLVEAL